MLKTKILFGLVLALCALGVSTAGASALKYQSNGPGKAIGKNHKFTVTGGEVTCEESEYSWKLTGEATTLPVVPSYSKCKVTGGSFKGVSATVKVSEGCEFTFGEPTETELMVYKATVSIGSSCKIVIIVTFIFTCEIKVEGAQGPLKTLTDKILNLTTKETEINAEVEGITYTANSNCSAGGITGGSTGKYAGITKAVGVQPS